MVGVLSKPNHAFPYPCSQRDILSPSYMSGRCTLQTKPRLSIPLHPCCQRDILSVCFPPVLSETSFLTFFVYLTFPRFLLFSLLSFSEGFFSPLRRGKPFKNSEYIYMEYPYPYFNATDRHGRAVLPRSFFFLGPPSRCFALKSATLAASLLLP